MLRLRAFERRVQVAWVVRKLVRSLDRLLLPAACPACQCASAGPGRLCEPCEDELELVAPGSLPGPRCFHDRGAHDGGSHDRELPCASCKSVLGSLHAIHASYLYRGAGGRCVRSLKLRKDPAALGLLGRAMARRFKLRDRRYRRAVLVPVPLSKKRRKERGFNQAEALAQFLARRLDIPLYTRALLRVRETMPQGSAAVSDREANLENAFALGPQGFRLLGAEVLLVDDVVTSGSTLRSCAKLLQRAAKTRSIEAVCACSALKPVQP